MPKCPQWLFLISRITNDFSTYLSRDIFYLKLLECINLGEESAQLCMRAETRSKEPK